MLIIIVSKFNHEQYVEIGSKGSDIKLVIGRGKDGRDNQLID